MDIAATISIFFIAALIRSTFGFADALIGMPLLLLFFPLPTADALMSSYAFITGVALVSTHHKLIIHNKKELLKLLAGATPGIVLGVLALHFVNHRFLLLALALLLIIYPFVRFFRFAFELKTSRSAPLVGLCAGFFGGAVSINGPFYVVYGQLRRWPTLTFVALLQPLFLFGNTISLIGYGVSGFITQAVLLKLVFALPALVVALLLGSQLRKLVGKHFQAYVLALVLLSGLSLIIKLFT